MEFIINFFANLFNSFSSIPLLREIIVFIVSMMPFLESRGGILLAVAFNLSPTISFIISLIANILVIPIALYFLEFIFKILRKINFFAKIITKIENTVLKKRDQLDKYGYIGLLLFVGIPFPGTGAWTGCFLASLLGMDKKKSFLYASLGVLLAGLIMMVISFGILKNIF